ncbi:MAG: PAC2 family protein [Dehalococcoidia bacterium]|nr:PAC2 family protein [Dehalococcoidia bacterium]
MDKLSDIIKIRARPKLKEPNLFAAWPGISNVAMIVATYIARKLEFKELASVRAPFFFDPIGVMVRNSIVEEPQFPQSRFFYWKNPRGKDLVLFIGEAQPNTNGYSLANCIIDAAEHFNVKRVYTCAAAISRIHHTEEPRVLGVGTNPSIVEELANYCDVNASNLQISGMNGILLGVAMERNMEGACLLGEVPTYTTRMQNPIAALGVARVLSKLLGVNIDFTELKLAATATSEGMKQVAAEAMGEYIDYFTEPIWERDEDDSEYDG